MNILLTYLIYHYCVQNKDLCLIKTKVHMDKLKTVLKSHNMDLGLLLIEVVTLPHGSIADQATYIKRLKR